METNACPEVLLATTAGIETQLLVPAKLRGRIHIAETWRPRSCWCGAVHERFDASVLTIFVGPDPPRRGRYNIRRMTVGLVPHGQREIERSYPLVHASTPRDFGPWAALFVRHVAGSLLTGLVGIDFVHVQALFHSPRRAYDFIRLDPSAPLGRVNARHGFLYVVGRPDLALDQIEELAGGVAAAMEPPARLLVAAAIDEQLRAPLEASLVLVR